MARSLWFARWGFAALAASAGLMMSSAAAQQPMPKPVLGFKGKLSQAVPNGIAVTDPTKNNALAFVEITPNTKLTVEGTADPSFLGPGVVVEFTAEMTRLGIMQGDLEGLTVCDVDPAAPLTFKPDDDTKTLPKEKDAIVRMLVRGTILNNKNGILQVRAPGAVVKAKLAASPKIKVLVHNYAWAQPGDTVLVDGQEISAAQGDQPQHILGTVVKITLEKTLEGKKKAVPMRKLGKS